MSNSAFHANDIRGIYPEEIDESLAHNIGFAFVKKTSAQKMFVGRDIRRSSKPLARAVIKGIREAGCSVIDLGLIDTPGMYFATGEFACPGIMITASHNPPKYNGLVLTLPGAITLGGPELKELTNYFGYSASKKKGKYKKKNIKIDYEKFVLSHVDKKVLKKIKIVVDTGNGMASLFVKNIFSKTPAKIVPLFWKLDGRFPHHLPDSSTPENLIQLQKAVKANNADLGIIFDGDADRAAFVDETGQIVPASCTAALLSENILSKEHGKILYNVIASRVLPETIKSLGGVPLIEKIGHTFMKKRMHAEHALLGAEEYGHYYFKSNHYADSGLIAALMMYEILSKSSFPLSLLVKKYKKYYKPAEIRIETHDKVLVSGILKAWCEKRNPKKKDSYDGVTYFYDEYWINVRASNTEPIIRIVLEAQNEKIGRKVENELRMFIKQEALE